MSFKVCQIGLNYGNKKEQTIAQHKYWLISMLNPLKHVLEEYCHLLMKMTLDSIIVAQVVKTWLCDVQVMF
jgi:hypothetical protein